MNYNELSVAQLREIAKEKNILKVSALKKQELIDALMALEEASAKKAAASVEEKPAKKPAKKAAAPVEEQPAKKPVKKAAATIEEKPAEKPVKKTVASAAEEKTEAESVKKTAATIEEKPAKKPAKKAAAPIEEQPAKKPVKKAAAPVEEEKIAAEEKTEAESAKKTAATIEEKPVKKLVKKTAETVAETTDNSAEKSVEKNAMKAAASSVSDSEADEMAAKRKAAAEIMAAAEVREAAQRIEQNAQPAPQRTYQNNNQNTQNPQSGAPRYNQAANQAGNQRNFQAGNQGGQQRPYQGGPQGAQRSFQTGGRPGQNNIPAGRPGYQQGGQSAGNNYQNRDGQSFGNNQPRNSQQRDNQSKDSQAIVNNSQLRDGYQQQSAENSSQNNGYQYKDPSVVANENMQNEQQQEASRKPLIPDIDYDARSIMTPEIIQLDSGVTKEGILEIMNDGYGFIRCDNFLPGEHDVYVSPAQIRKLNLKTGDIISGNTKIKGPSEKFSALLYVKTVNGRHPSEAHRRPKFEDLTPIFPHERIHLETPGCTSAMRIVDMLSPIGKGQRGMIVSQPKAGKTTLLKQIAKAITTNYPDMHLIILLIDERPEEVTDMKESIEGKNVEVIYSTFDELPENHKRVSEMVIERAKRLVEHKMDVCVLLDSITRLARAYNLTCAASGRTLSGGLDPAALHMPKKFFGAARCMREGGSLTILATALVDTGSRMDDVVFEEFKGTGNMELVLDRNLSEKRIFPAIDLPRSSTRRDDLLLSQQELEVNEILRHAFNSARSDQMIEKIINLFANTRTNREFCETVKKTKLN